MNQFFLLLLLLITNSLLAQNTNDNYVVRVPNSATPSTGNTLLGPGAGNATMTQGCNVFVGYVAGAANTSGSDNIALGANAGEKNTTGIMNTFVGNFSGNINTMGVQNTFVGYNAGSNNVIGNNNVMLGFGATPTSSSLVNAVAIGSNARVALSHAIVLGDYTNGNLAVGIGTDSPQFPLDVRGIIRLRNNGTIKYTHLVNPNLRNGMTDQFLTVNEEGETVLARHRIRIDNVAQWSDKGFDPTYHLPSLNEVERYVQVHGHLPNVPSAEDVVKEGIDLVKMNATLLEKVEELTLYSIEQDKTIKQQLDNQELKQQMAELKALMKQVLEKK